MTQIAQKWGFGMAPVKPEVQLRRERAASLLLKMFNEYEALPKKVVLASISEFKGCVTRAWKCDQWDWFTVWSQLGHRPKALLSRVSSLLTELRKAVKEDARPWVEAVLYDLEQHNLKQLLRLFLGQERQSKPPGIVYALGTREAPDILKVGMTTRDPVKRVNEINSATGVVVPYGVRGTWAVTDPMLAESAAHNALADFRIRGDREFFKLPFPQASAVITQATAEFRFTHHD